MALGQLNYVQWIRINDDRCVSRSGAGIACSVCVVFLAFFGATLVGLVDSHQESDFIDALLLHEMVAASIAIHSTRKWLDSSGRRNAAEHLQSAASLASQSLWKLLKPRSGGTGETREWFQERGNVLAGMLLGLTQAVLWPRSDTRDYVSAELKRMTSCILRGDWTEAANTNSLNFARPDRRLQLRTILLQGFFGVVPLAALGFLRLIKVPVPSAIEPYVALGAYLWAIVSLLVVLDPHLEKRLSTLRATVQLLKGKSD